MAKMAVRYVGGSTYRALTESDLGALGLKVELPATSEFYRRVVEGNSWSEADQRPLDPARDLLWGPHNRWTLEMDVSPELESVLRQQDHFVLSAVTDSGSEGERVAEAGPEADHPGDVIVTHVEGEPSQKADTPREEGEPFVVDGEAEAPALPAESEPESGEMASGTGASGPVESQPSGTGGAGPRNS